MCGIGLIVGANPDVQTFHRMMAALKPRGEIEEVIEEPGLLCGTQRLPIVDRQQAIQPWQSPDGRWVLCYNGEIFNHGEIRQQLRAAGVDFRSESDTEVALEAFLYWGEAGLMRLRGEFAFAVVERATGRVFLARDPVGVKPLYWTSRSGCLYIASEVKALVPVGAPIHEVPPGHLGWAEPGGTAPVLSPYVDLLRLAEDQAPIHDLDEAKFLVRTAIEDSIRVRVDTDLTVGVILSGGLDSSLTLLNVLKMHPDCVAFTIGTAGSEDMRYARRLTAELGVRHEVIELEPGGVKLDDIRTAIRLSELTEYGDVINAVVSTPLFRRVHQCGVKVVLAGDGSDELFGGYDMYRQADDGIRERLFRHKILNLSRTELQRVDRTSMGFGVEVRVPFLDIDLIELALRLPIGFKVHEGREKWILREAFADVLPDYIRQRPKNPMSHSSGLHERARLFKPLFARIYRSFGYDLLGPMRRDFSIVLEQHDLDLDQALAAVDARGDFTPAEHLRDFVGALRWNVQTAVKARTGAGAHGPT